MPPSRTVDIKLSFPQFNGEPGPDCRRFRRDLIQCGGQTDSHGASIADCLLREDEGAVQYGTGIPGVPAVAVPGVQAIAAGNAGRSARQRREARLKQSATYLLLHLDNDTTKNELDQPRFHQNGPEMFDYIMETCLLPLTTVEVQDLMRELQDMSIKYDVGSNENSVTELARQLRVKRLLHCTTQHPERVHPPAGAAPARRPARSEVLVDDKTPQQRARS